MISDGWPHQKQYIDIRDQQGIWQVGLVLNKNQRQIKIRLDGWPSKYDETLFLLQDPSKPSRIQPFRSHTRGYTGYKKNVTPRQHWKFTNQDLQLRLRKIQEFTANRRQKSSTQLTQFLRGQNYLYIDFLLGTPYHQQQDLANVYQYFKLHIGLTNTYIQEILDTGITHWLSKLSTTTNQQLQVKEQDGWEGTYADCYFQIFQALFNIAGLNERLSHFQRNNDEAIKKISDIYQTHENYISSELLSTGTYGSIKKLIMQAGMCQAQTPIIVVYSLFQLYLSIEKSLLLQKDTDLTLILDCLSQITARSLQKISGEDVKTNSMDRQIEEVLSRIKIIMTKHNKIKEISNWVEQFRLKYYLLITQSNSIERKFKGISKLKEYCLEFINYSISDKKAIPKTNPFSVRLRKVNLVETLFSQNKHGQFFKTSLDLIILLYQYGLIGIEALIYIWNHSIHRQAIQLKSLYKFCVSVVANILPQDIPTLIDFIHIVNKYYSEGKNDSVEFYFQFVQAITKTINTQMKKDTSIAQFVELQKTTTVMIHSLYQNVFNYKEKSNLKAIINSYSNTILLSSHYSTFVQQLFDNLSNRLLYRLSIIILQQVYLAMGSLNFYLPENYSTIFLNCIKINDPTQQQIKEIMKLFNSVLLIIEEIDDQYELKPAEFKEFWDLFQLMPQPHKNIFYEWLTNANKEVVGISQINQVIYPDLKSYILFQVLSEQNFASIQNLTKKQLYIILQFYLEVNRENQYIQIKAYNDNYRLFTLRSIQTIKEDLLWSIFKTCRNTQVISILNKFLINIHFFYAPIVAYNLRKSRVDEFITKIKQYFYSAYDDHNTLLIKHSLMLLKSVIEIIKEQRLQISNSQTSIKITFLFQNKTFPFDVKYDDTIGNIKLRLATHLKIKPFSLKIMNAKSEQLSFEAKDIPIFCVRDKHFIVAQIPEQEETMSKFVYFLLSQSMEQVLFKMLQIEESAQQVYQFLNLLQLKQDRNAILKRIDDIILKQKPQYQPSCKSIHYYYLLQIKIYQLHAEDKAFIQQALSTSTLKRLITTLNYPILLEIHVQLIFRVSNILVKIFKEGIQFEEGQDLAERCLDLVHQIYLFAEKNQVSMAVTDLFTRIIYNVNFLMEEVVTKNQMLSFILFKKGYEELLELLYFSSKLQDLKVVMMEKIKEYLGNYTTKNIILEEVIFQLYCDTFYQQLIHLFKNKLLKQTKGTQELFTAIYKILKVISQQKFEQFANLPHLFYQQIMEFIHSILQSKRLIHLEAADLMICGHLNLLHVYVQKFPRLKSMETMNFILTNCLNSQDISKVSLSRHPSAKKACFKIIQQILSNNQPQFFKRIIESFEGIQKTMFWRTQNKWSIDLGIEMGRAYRGLLNPGCICYMNSLLQQLFMIQSFRMGILQLNAHFPQVEDNQQDDSNENEASILQEMKKLFLKLIFSEENTISAVPFSKTIKNPSGKPFIKINQQMDIDEFEAILFQKVEKELQVLGSTNIIRQLFGGVYSNQIISLQCSHRSEREESFISISLQVKENIYQSFKAFVKVDLLDNDNKYFCELCNKKVKAEKMQSIKKLPPFLIVCLKRFSFNFLTESKIKINTFCQFYPRIHLQEFSTHELNHNRMADQQIQDQQMYNDEQFNYKLRGVVIHSGSADSGHYYSLIQNESGAWFQFNDDLVIPFDFDRLPEQAFGNKSKHDEQVSNAYLLIYERQQPNSSREAIRQQVANKEEWLVEEELSKLQQNQKLISNILKKNHQMQKYSLVFSQSYQDFMQFFNNKFEEITTKDNEPQFQEKWQEFYLSYYFLVLIRKDFLNQFLTFSKNIEESLLRNAKLRQKYLRLFTSCNFIDEFFVSSQSKDRSRVIAHLFSTAFIEYINDTLASKIEQNELFYQILETISLMLTVYGQLNELTRGLRRVFEYLAQNQPRHLQYIIKNFTFENIYLDNIFGNVIHQKRKEYLAKKIQQNQRTVVISFIPPTYVTDRKQAPLVEQIQSWIVISILLRQNNKMIEQFPQQADAQTANLLYLSSIVSEVNIAKTTTVLYQCTNERGAACLYQAYKELNLEGKICQGLENGLSVYESVRYRPFMLLVIAIIRDTSRRIDLNAIIDILQKVYRSSDKYFFETDLLTQWMVRFLVCSQQFLKQFQARTDFLQTIFLWCEKPHEPSAQQLKKHKIPGNHKLLNRYYGIVVSSDPKQYKTNIRSIKKVYQSVLDEMFTLKGMVGRIEQPFTQGKEVKYFQATKSQWIESGCQVISNTFGYLCLKLDNGDQVYIWQDSQKVKICKDEVEVEIEKQSDQNSDLSFDQQQ